MNIESLIRYLQLIQTKHPGLDVMCPIPNDDNMLIGAIGIVIAEDNGRQRFGSLIGISQDEIAKMKILKETTPPDKDTGLRHFSAGDVINPHTNEGF